jgi:multiple sugar transport system permease protein
VFYLCIATLFLPYPVILVALFDIFGRLPSFGLQGSRSWVNTFLPLIVPAFFGNPFYIFLMRQFMLGIPRELSDAARVDGANEIQTFWRVILPLTKPAVVVVAIFAAVGAWNEFLLPLLYLQENSKYPLAVGLAFYTSEHDVAYNLLMAAATLVVLPVIVVFIFGQRFFVEGITVGGVKG